MIWAEVEALTVNLDAATTLRGKPAVQSDCWPTVTFRVLCFLDRTMNHGGVCCKKSGCCVANYHRFSSGSAARAEPRASVSGGSITSSA